MRKHHNKGHDHLLSQNPAEPVSSLHFRTYDNVRSHVFHRFSKSLRFFGENSGCEGFFQEEECKELDAACKDGCDIEDPPPINDLGDVGPTNGGDTGCYPYEGAVYSLAFATFFLAPCVGQDAITQLSRD
jgi:hypothetical protein